LGAVNGDGVDADHLDHGYLAAETKDGREDVGSVVGGAPLAAVESSPTWR